MRYEFSCHENWHSRRLPHYDAEGKYQMVTYRLADSLPKNALEIIKNKCDQLSGSDSGSPVKEIHHNKHNSGLVDSSPVINTNKAEKISG